MRNYLWLILLAGLLTSFSSRAHDDWKAVEYSMESASEPSPLPDRIVLTWEDDTSTTQSVTWRTDTSVKVGSAQIAVANSNGWALKPETFQAETTRFKSDINEANYHSVTFRNLSPDTLYAYRVGDGVNWSEYLHFSTASDEPKAFSFIYLGDAQNQVRMHWSRVFREAFRDAPRAAFTLHAGDLVDFNDSDVQWGDWHQGPDWVNGTIPVIATPGNHEYRRIGEGPRNERFWNTKKGARIEVNMTSMEATSASTRATYKLSFLGPDKQAGELEISDGGNILDADDGIKSITGFTDSDLVGTSFYAAPLFDAQRQPGTPAVSTHWRPQFAFPIQDVPDPSLAETLYYIDYQGVRFISLDSNLDPDIQVPWLRGVLANNPNTWTVITFHHPIFSPGSDRDNPVLRKTWKPILDEYRVDLVLSGHDHAYSRTGLIDVNALTNVPDGYEKAYDPEIGTVHVVSVSGPKLYEITKGNYAKRVAQNTQLYQIIQIDGNELTYRAYEATGQLYDEFKLQKRKGAANLLIESQSLPVENRG